MKGRSRGRVAYRSEPHKLIGVIGHILLALTNRSPLSVYNLMRQVTLSAYPPVSLYSFYKLLRVIHPFRGKETDKPPKGLLRLCKLRLHPVFFTTQSDDLAWLLLLGFETETGFCNAQWFNIRRQKGTPKVDSEVITDFDKTSGGKVSNNILARFCASCQSRLHLPLVRFQLPLADCADALKQLRQFRDQSLTVDVSKMPPSVILIQDTPSPDQLERFQGRVLRLINRYNRTVVSEKTQVVWSKIEAQLRKPGRPKSNLVRGDQRCKKRIEGALIKDDLIKFYKDRSRYPGRIARLSKQVTTLRMQKMPDSLGKTTPSQPPPTPKISGITFTIRSAHVSPRKPVAQLPPVILPPQTQ